MEDVLKRLYVDFELNDSVKKCDVCKKRGSSFIKTFYTGPIGESCFFCAALYVSDIRNYCEKVENPISNVAAVYADGGLLAMNRLGGVWAWCGVTSSGHRVISERGTVLEQKLKQVVTNNHTEQIALIRALEAMPEGWSGKVYSDSNIALGRIFWKYGSKNLPWIIEQRTEAAVRRLGKVEPILLQGHPTETELLAGVGERRPHPVSIHNHFCDLECEKEKKSYYELNK